MTTIATMIIVGKRGYGTGSLYQRNGCWYGRWRDAAGRHAKKLGPVRQHSGREGLTKKQAQAELQKLMLAAADSAVRPASVTVADLADVFCETLKREGRKPSHLASTRSHIRTHIKPLLGSLDAAQVEASDVRRLITRLESRQCSAKTIHNIVGTMHSILELAAERKMVDRNVASEVRLPAVRASSDLRFLTRAEIDRVLEAPPGEDASQSERDQWPVTRLFILTAASSGLRLGELRALRWRDLDMAAMKIRVRQNYVAGNFGTPKSARSERAVPLASRLFRELDQHHRDTPYNTDDDLVLGHPHSGRPLVETRLRDHFKAALRRANVRAVRIHDLRHTFGTTVAASGQVSVRTLQEWMGHASITTTQIYAHYMPGDREQQLLDAALDGVSNPQRPVEVAKLVANSGQNTPPRVAGSADES